MAKHRKIQPSRRAALIGVGSLMDLRGQATYERMRREMPATTRRTTLNQSINKATGQFTAATNRAS